MLQQTIDKLEKQLSNVHGEKQMLEQTNQTYQEKLSECEKMIISLKETNKNKEYLLEQKKSELNSLQTNFQTLTYEQTATVAKVC